MKRNKNTFLFSSISFYPPLPACIHPFQNSATDMQWIRFTQKSYQLRRCSSSVLTIYLVKNGNEAYVYAHSQQQRVKFL